MPEVRWNGKGIAGRAIFPTLLKVRSAKLAPRTVPDVQHSDPFLFLQDTVNDSVNVRIMTVQQVLEIAILGGRWATVGELFKAQDRVRESLISFPGPSVDCLYRRARSRFARAAMLTNRPCSASNSAKNSLAGCTLPFFTSSNPWWIPSVASA